MLLDYDTGLARQVSDFSWTDAVWCRLLTADIPLLPEHHLALFETHTLVALIDPGQLMNGRSRIRWIIAPSHQADGVAQSGIRAGSCGATLARYQKWFGLYLNRISVNIAPLALFLVFLWSNPPSSRFVSRCCSPVESSGCRLYLLHPSV